MKEKMIEVKNLEKSFNRRKVIDGLNIQVEKGECFGLLGHNGAGKSTTIDILLGLKKPDKGEALVFGKEVAKDKNNCFEKIGVQLQASHYQPGLRVEEACIERAALYRTPRDYEELLKMFGLEALKGCMVEKLSGGEKQRLSVALALIGNPEVVFLDELTTGLDVAARREVWRTLKILKDDGITLFLTTHYMEEAQKLCDRICIIKGGKEITSGTVEKVIEQSPYDNLEEAYLWYLDEEVEL